MRWGGIGIRLVSDLSVVFSAPGATGGNANPEEVDDGSSDKTVGSVSIISSSSSLSSAVTVGSARDARVDGFMAASSSSFSGCWGWDEEGWDLFLRVIVLRFFFFVFTSEVDGIVEAKDLSITTIVLRGRDILRCHVCCHAHTILLM